MVITEVCRKVLAALISSMLFLLSGCTAASSTDRIDWKLYGTWITGSCEVKETMELSISGTVTLADDGVDTLELDIVMPQAFRYGYNGAIGCTSESRKYFDLACCVCPYYAYDKVKNGAVFTLCTFFLERWNIAPLQMDFQVL